MTLVMKAERILVALDLKQNDDTLRAVVAEACKAVSPSTTTVGNLQLFTVLPEREHGAAPAPNLFEPAGNSLARIREAEASLGALEEELVPTELRGGVNAVIAAHPWQAICDIARATRPDLVVIGAHHHGFVERVLGTTAARVVNHIDSPVLVVRLQPVEQQREEKETVRDQTGVDERTAHFGILKASALAGATGGAAVGAMGGPPGIILGGALGAAAGLLAGSVLDIEEQRASMHDHELDDEIGVTKGDLGAREAAREHLGDEAEETTTTTGEGVVLLHEEARSLRAKHEELDKVYVGLLDSYRGGDWREVAAAWRQFEPLILRHLEFEEVNVFPFFRQVNEGEAEALLAEHEELRALLTTLGMNIDLHALLHTDAEELVRRLRAHAEREEKIFYPWIDVALKRERPAAA